MHIRAVLEELEVIAPPVLADEEDAGRIGLIVEGDEEVENVCCGVDVTSDLVKEAVSRQCNLIVSHHNPFYEALAAVKGYDADLLRRLLSARINLYVMHTNFDRAPGGVNDTLAGLLEMEHVKAMPLGVIGTCRLSPEEIGERLNAPLFLHGRLDRLQTLALVGGSGFQPALIEYAFHLGADAFLSAELKHHVDLRSPLPLLESTHYDLEAPAIRQLAKDRDWTFVDTNRAYRMIR